MWINLIIWQSLIVPFKKKKESTFYNAFVFLWRAKLNYFDAKVDKESLSAKMQTRDAFL